MPLLLAMLALATTGSAQRAPDPKALFERAAQALAARDYATAERGFREVLKLDPRSAAAYRSEEHTSELQSRLHIVCRLLLEQKKPIVAERPEAATDAWTTGATAGPHESLSCRARRLTRD